MNSILKHFLNWLLFSGTMWFAAGAVIDAGAMDGAGDGSNPDAGVADGNLGDAGDGADADGSGDGSSESGAVRDGAAGQSNGDRVDGRTLPKEVQSALKSLKEAHPEHAKALEELRKSYFSSRQHGEFFKTPAEARQAHATLQLAGGAQGIAEMQSKVAAIEMVDTSFEQGDPQVLEDIASDYPEGFKKLIGPAIEKLQALDPQSYAKTLQPHNFAAMEAAGLGPVLDAIGQAVAANDLAKAKDLIGKSLAWYQGQKQQAGQVKQNSVDPERAKFETERQKFHSEKEQSFRQAIGSKTSAHQHSEVEKALAPYLKTKSLTNDERADITAGINGRVNALLKADGTYQSQMKALLAAKNRDPEKIIQYVKAAVSEKAAQAVRARYGNKAPSPKAAAAAATDKTNKPVGNPAQSGPIKIAAKPNRADVDWSKTKDILFITNKAYMKNGPHKGKMVTW